MSSSQRYSTWEISSTTIIINIVSCAIIPSCTTISRSTHIESPIARTSVARTISCCTYSQIGISRRFFQGYVWSIVTINIVSRIIWFSKRICWNVTIIIYMWLTIITTSIHIQSSSCWTEYVTSISDTICVHIILVYIWGSRTVVTRIWNSVSISIYCRITFVRCCSTSSIVLTGLCISTGIVLCFTCSATVISICIISIFTSFCRMRNIVTTTTIGICCYCINIRYSLWIEWSKTNMCHTSCCNNIPSHSRSASSIYSI